MCRIYFIEGFLSLHGVCVYGVGRMKLEGMKDYEYTGESGRAGSGEFESVRFPKPEFQGAGQERRGVRHTHGVPEGQGQDFAFQVFSEAER